MSSALRASSVGRTSNVVLPGCPGMPKSAAATGEDCGKAARRGHSGIPAFRNALTMSA